MKVLLNDQAEHFINNLNVDSRSYEGVAGVYQSIGSFIWFKFSDEGCFDAGEEKDFNNAFIKIK